MLLLWGVCGCSTTRVDLGAARAALPYRGAGPVQVAVEDARKQVAQNYVGVVRITMGIPFDVLTEGDVPLAEAMRAALSGSLQAAGFRSAKQSARQVVLQVRGWKSDGYFEELSVAFDVSLRVVRGGKVQARVAKEGTRTTAYAGREQYAAGCRQLFERLLQELLSAPEVKAALTGDVDPAPKNPRACTCGAALQSDWVACPKCGAKLKPR